MPEGSKKSRLKSYTDLDGTSSFLTMPSLDGAEYLVQLLYEAGLVQSNGMGATALSWTEIESWIRVTQISLSVWERLLIKSMSEVYAGELSQATAKDRPSPYVHVDEALEINRQVVTAKLKNVFALFRKNNASEADSSASG